jgi:hypothetical protein
MQFSKDVQIESLDFGEGTFGDDEFAIAEEFIDIEKLLLDGEDESNGLFLLVFELYQIK